MKKKQKKYVAQAPRKTDDDAIPEKCWECKTKQQVLVKVIRDQEVFVKTQNRIGNCPNVDCFRHSDSVDIPSWVKETSIIVTPQVELE